MLNLFAATGHINKSSRLYLQLMRELSCNHPWFYSSFIEHGFHTVRRTERYWARLWTNLVIEQVMMRPIKSRRGLTRGRGVTESAHLQWICSMHKSAGIRDTMTTNSNKIEAQNIRARRWVGILTKQTGLRWPENDSKLVQYIWAF